MVEVKSTNRVCFCQRLFGGSESSRRRREFLSSVCCGWSVVCAAAFSLFDINITIALAAEAMQQGSQFNRPSCFCSDVPSDTIERMEQCDMQSKWLPAKSKSTLAHTTAKETDILPNSLVTFISGCFLRDEFD